jgi:F-type H+-transporting ATPase subunit delta
MPSSLLSQRYAAALADAVPANESAAFVSFLETLLKTLEEHPSLRPALVNPAYPVHQRGEAIKAVAARLPAPASFENFLNLLVENNRLDALPSILQETLKRKTLELRGAGATVFTAAPANAQEQESLSRQARQLIPEVQDIRFAVDSRLLGGFQVQHGSKLYDYSVHGRLERLRRHVLAG